jgi:hypothetical protein
VDAKGWTPQCLQEDGFSTSRVIRWAPDGKSLFAFGTVKLNDFGMVRYTSKKAFSPDRADWGKGKIVTVHDKPGRGAIDLSLSADGARMAVVANFEGQGFELHFTKPGDFELADDKVQRAGVLACKADFRPDSLELIVAQGGCQSNVSDQLIRVPVKNPRRDQVSLKNGGDNPAWQPLRPETAK